MRGRELISLLRSAAKFLAAQQVGGKVNERQLVAAVRIVLDRQRSDR
jgi:hypothetical protein